MELTFLMHLTATQSLTVCSNTSVKQLNVLMFVSFRLISTTDGGRVTAWRFDVDRTRSGSCYLDVTSVRYPKSDG